MNRHGVKVALRSGLIALTWSVAGQALAADVATQEPPAQEKLEELGEVLVEGLRSQAKRPTFKQYQQPFSFLARLVGEFVIEGQVDVRGQGRSLDFRKVSGRAECVGFGSAPGVQCELKARWPAARGPNGEEIPGGISALNPAVMLLGFDPVLPGISWILVDSKGNADTAVGKMATPDTMQSRSKCVGIAGNCERVAQITAWPDLKTVDMKIDLVVDEQTAVGFTFVMHRVPGTGSVTYGRKEDKKK
jgi:hypothetical protein